MSEDRGIEHISDTARWVAVYRAMETERPDAHFRDPFARRLAGARGEEIVRTLPDGRASAWPMIVRTCVIDELVLGAIQGGVKTVVNLAAGLDSRPYRMPLPAELEWLEVDLPGIIAYKTQALKEDRPRCRLERVALDLSDRAARRAFLAGLDRRPAPVLVLSEGLVIYLERAQVEELASDLAASAVDRWIVDYCRPELLAMLEKRWKKPLEAGNSSFKFSVSDGPGFFAARGWAVAEERFMGEEAKRLGREMKLAWLWRLLARVMPASRRELYRRMSTIALLRKTPA